VEDRLQLCEMWTEEIVKVFRLDSFETCFTRFFTITLTNGWVVKISRTGELLELKNN